jgi:CMP-N,N'-diacetyllegionaminic acid synthase
MIRAKTVLALVIARGGSKGVPRKNLRQIGGKSLLAWALDAAAASRHVDRTVVSSDDVEIIELAKRLGAEAPFVRPAQLARDDTAAVDVVLHALAVLEEHYDYVVLLQPTSPMRIGDDIDGCLALCDRTGAPSVVSVTEAKKSPYWMYRIDADLHMTPLMESPRPTRRQDIPRIYELNGAVFVARTIWLGTARDLIDPESRAYVMPMDRSIDIDSESDFEMARTMMEIKNS